MSSTAFIIESGNHHVCTEFAGLNPNCLGTREEVEMTLEKAGPDAVWIVLSAEVVPWLASVLLHIGPGGSGLLLSLPAIPPALIALFGQRFRRVASAPERMLPHSELATILCRQDRADFCIGGTVVLEARLVTLLRGDLSVMTVPLSDFRPSGKGLEPDPSRFDVVDHGHTLKFGEYEAPFDTVLYERDKAYRQRIKKQRLAEDGTFGGALRRLRLQKRKRLADMAGIAKTVARIERGEVKTPQERTLRKIADVLGVVPEEIEDY